jgi:hypothetical protein
VGEPFLPEPASRWRAQVYHRGIAIWYFVAGALFLFAPDEWYGPTWSYFADFPHGGFGLGLSCLLLGGMMTYAIRRRNRRLMLWALAMGGTAFWVAACLIATEGLMGGTGFMEAPFMLYISIDLFLNGSVLRWPH